MSEFAGTWQLVRLAVRRDRILLPVWTAVFVLVAASSASATVGIYPTTASRVAAAESINNTPSLVALYGRIYDPTSLGAVSLVKLVVFGAALVGVLAIITVVRHTRQEEETGRLELVGAAVVGRRASLTAAVLVAVVSNLVLGVLAAGGLVAAGLGPLGSLVFGLAWAGNGVAFAGIAAVAAQLTTSARAATGLATAVLGGSYLLRALGDTSASQGWLSYLSPLGWAQQMRPFAGNRWSLLLAIAVFCVAMVVTAFLLAGRRDLGAGLLGARPGPATAKASLRTPLALAWRLQSGLLLGWCAGFVLLGGVVGNIATKAGSFLDNKQAQDFIRRLGGHQGLTDAFVAAELGIAAVVAAAFGVQAVLRLRAEETALHAEALLGTAVSRLSFAVSHLTVALAGTAALLAVGGASAGLATGDPGQVPRLLGSAVAHLPEVWVVIGIAVAVFGLVPEASVAAWVALVLFLLLGIVGPLLQLPSYLLDISPFAHAPRLPGGSFDLTAASVLTAVAAALTLLGLGAWRRRDLSMA